MLKALLQENEVLGWKIPRPINPNNQYTCTDCNQPLIFVDALIKIPHFRHYPRPDCRGIREQHEPESETHLLMKKQISEQLFPKDIWCCIEKWTENNKADILNIAPQKYQGKAKSWAIECQASSISKKKLLQRTQSYNDQGIPVLWVFEEEMYYKLPYSFKNFIQSIFFGRAYVYNVKRNEFGGYRFDGSEVYDWKIDNLRMFEVNSSSKKYGDFLILRFYDKKRW